MPCLTTLAATDLAHQMLGDVPIGVERRIMDHAGDHRRRILRLADDDLHRVHRAAVFVHPQPRGGGVDQHEAALGRYGARPLEVGAQQRRGAARALRLGHGGAAQRGIGRIDLRRPTPDRPPATSALAASRRTIDACGALRRHRRVAIDHPRDRRAQRLNIDHPAPPTSSALPWRWRADRCALRRSPARSAPRSAARWSARRAARGAAARPVRSPPRFHARRRTTTAHCHAHDRKCRSRPPRPATPRPPMAFRRLPPAAPDGTIITAVIAAPLAQKFNTARSRSHLTITTSNEAASSLPAAEFFGTCETARAAP